MKHVRALLILSIAAACTVLGISVRAFHSEPATQDTIALDRRINMLEQRLYTIETRIIRLEQQSSLNSAMQPSSTQRELQLDSLQRQIVSLQNGMNEIDCGLARLDERTLPASVR